MRQSNHSQHSEVDERLIREAALDETIKASSSASVPPSTKPNFDADEALEERVPGGPGPRPER